MMIEHISSDQMSRYVNDRLVDSERIRLSSIWLLATSVCSCSSLRLKQLRARCSGQILI